MKLSLSYIHVTLYYKTWLRADGITNLHALYGNYDRGSQCSMVRVIPGYILSLFHPWCSIGCRRVRKGIVANRISYHFMSSIDYGVGRGLVVFDISSLLLFILLSLIKGCGWSCLMVWVCLLETMMALFSSRISFTVLILCLATDISDCATCTELPDSQADCENLLIGQYP